MTIFPLLAVLLAPAHAACAAQKPVIIAGTQGYADDLADGECFVDVGPASTPDMRYRSYTFYDSGLLVVFGSYGEGTNSATTGAREYYFFPRLAPAALKMDAQAGTVAVAMANGDEIVFDPETAQIRSSRRGEVTVSPRVDPADRGGVEFPRYDGLLLDTGYTRGRSPATSPDGQSVFRDVYGHLCRVANREIFDYAGGEHSFKFTDPKLSAWLKKRCPAVRVNF